jgi:hypothetical protein
MAIDPSLVIGIPASINMQIQQGLLERAFHDGLFPSLLFRKDAEFEPWQENMGTELMISRPGLLPVVSAPLRAGFDPLPVSMSTEQWVAVVQRYANRTDVHMPTSAVANSNLFLRSVHQLGLNAGQSVNRLPRNELFKAYLSGQSVLLAATGTNDTTIRVAAINGFTDVLIPGTLGTVRAVPVSAAYPLPITIGTRSNTVIGYVPDTIGDTMGPGTLLLGAVVGGVVAIRSAVVSFYAPTVQRSGGGTSVDALAAGDTITMQDFFNATNFLRSHNVEPHEDGLYHAHVHPNVINALTTDPAFQRLYQGQPNEDVYKTGVYGIIAGVKILSNNEVPLRTNSGTLTATGTNAFYASDIGAEVINENAVDVARTIVTGKGSLYEYGLDESNYVSEAGITGKIGEFNIVNNGVQIDIERVRLIIRAPINVMQDQVSLAWSITAGWPIPSDAAAPTGNQRFKRAVVIESALI